VCWLSAQLEASKTPVAAIILQSPYTSIRDAASDLLGFTSNFMLDRWPNWLHLVGNGDPNHTVIKSPVLFLHADNDKIINFNHSKLMHSYREKLNLPSELFVQTSAENFIKGHNIFDYERDVVYPSKMFLAKHVPSSSNAFIALPLDVLQRVSRIPLPYYGVSNNHNADQPVKGNRMERDSPLIDPSQPRSDAASISSPNEYSGIVNKCSDYEALAGWTMCCCVFCGECCIAMGYKVCMKSFYAISGTGPFFDYQSLRPDTDDVKKGTILLLFDKSSIAEGDEVAPAALKKQSSSNNKSHRGSLRVATPGKRKSTSISINEVKNPLQASDNKTIGKTAEEDLPYAKVVIPSKKDSIDYIPG